MSGLIGRIHSFQSLGTVDGPGVRAVVFMQGCPLRCACCHNPDTWDASGGVAVTVEELLAKIRRCRPYFGEQGGVTVSGGEPLMQADFVRALFSRLHEEGIHTALDTAGCVLTPAMEALLGETDLVLLDYKYTDAADYRALVGCEQVAVDRFLAYTAKRHIPVWLRQVSIPEKNEDVANDRRLTEMALRYANVERVELLPFRKLCIEKYRALGIPFPLEETPEADAAAVFRRQETIARDIAAARG